MRAFFCFGTTGGTSPVRDSDSELFVEGVQVSSLVRHIHHAQVGTVSIMDHCAVRTRGHAPDAFPHARSPVGGELRQGPHREQ